MIEPLATDRLLLNPIAPADREFILAQFSDPDVTRFMYDEEPFSDISQADALIRSYLQGAANGTWRWVLSLRENRETVGTCGFHHWDRAARSIEVGYDLALPYQGRGLMQEAMIAAMAFARQTLGITRCDAIIAVDNEKSIGLAEKLGFEFRGHQFWDSFRERQYLHRTYSRSME